MWSLYEYCRGIEHHLFRHSVRRQHIPNMGGSASNAASFLSESTETMARAVGDTAGDGMVEMLQFAASLKERAEGSSFHVKSLRALHALAQAPHFVELAATATRERPSRAQIERDVTREIFFMGGCAFAAHVNAKVARARRRARRTAGCKLSCCG